MNIHVGFGFILKNGSDYIKKNMNRLMNIGKMFKSYSIFFVENDSTDNTKEILQQFIDQNNNIKGKFITMGDSLYSTQLCKSSESHNCPKRIQRLAQIRNTLLDFVQYEHKFKGDYFVMMDIDFVYLPDPSELFLKMEHHKTIDAIFGISLTTDYNFYDIGCITPWISKIHIMLGFQKWIKVNSSFSGFGLYRWNSIQNIRYDQHTTDIEHISFNHKLSNLYVNTLFNPLYIPSDIKFKSINQTYMRIIVFIIIYSLCLLLYKLYRYFLKN